MLLDHCIRFVAVAFRSEGEDSWRRGPPVTYFCPALDPPRGGSGRKTTTLVRDHEYFFHQNPSSGFGEEVEDAFGSGELKRQSHPTGTGAWQVIGTILVHSCTTKYDWNNIHCNVTANCTEAGTIKYTNFLAKYMNSPSQIQWNIHLVFLQLSITWNNR